MKRPDMRAYFKARIDVHVNGLMSQRSQVRLPADVRKISGGVTDQNIVVTMLDGTQWYWRGGQYAARKVNLCYAPKMPTPFTPADSES